MMFIVKFNPYIHDPGLLTLTQGQQEKWIQKSCVSVEEECMIFKSLQESGLLFETIADISILKGNSSLLSVNLS